MNGSHIPLAALIPFALIGLAFEVYCLVDIWRARSVRYLSKWVWAAITFFGGFLGGIFYLFIGREER